MKRSFTVTMKIPEKATLWEAQLYIEDAVKSWHGSLEPPGVDSGDGTLTKGNPMFDLDEDSVSVRLQQVHR